MEEDSFVFVEIEDIVQQPQQNPSHNPRASEYFHDVEKCLDNLEVPLWELNSFIHKNPELAFREFKAHNALTEFLKLRPCWRVMPSAYGMETAWVAEYDSGHVGPVVSFNVEMDALPDLGHACGHNLIASASMAAGLATAEVMKRHKLAGKVILFGTPGEEGYKGGKILFLEKGAYENVDVSLISHPGILHNSPLIRTTAFARLEVEYFGRAAHGGKEPWKGINALDALVVSYNAVAALRQQTMPGDVIGIAITNGGEKATNMIHSYAACVCMLHTRTALRLEELLQKVRACFRAGAEATGSGLNITWTPGYEDHMPNRVLAASYTKYWDLIPDPPQPPIPEPGPGEESFTWVPSSTDQGNLSHAMPSINVSFAIPPGPKAGQPHTPDFEGAAGTREAFRRALRVGKALAGTAIDVLTQPALLDEVRKQWEHDMDSIGRQELMNQGGWLLYDGRDQRHWNYKS
ncbi:hypothetical protein B0J18DRAFT_440286 [Chaetomium sp. MPI-SDFR-AT-0129]|nr:hypothetical protein B0J18DRAFT_440286 [Chaetomium sp. MPI-SDFR-AT-0129]